MRSRVLCEWVWLWLWVVVGVGGGSPRARLRAQDQQWAHARPNRLHSTGPYAGQASSCCDQEKVGSSRHCTGLRAPTRQVARHLHTYLCTEACLPPERRWEADALHQTAIGGGTYRREYSQGVMDCVGARSSRCLSVPHAPGLHHRCQMRAPRATRAQDAAEPGKRMLLS